LIIFPEARFIQAIYTDFRIEMPRVLDKASEIVREYGFQLEMFSYASVVISKGMSKSVNAPSAASLAHSNACLSSRTMAFALCHFLSAQ
jgi:hypothetical protein